MAGPPTNFTSNTPFQPHQAEWAQFPSEWGFSSANRTHRCLKVPNFTRNELFSQIELNRHDFAWNGADRVPMAHTYASKCLILLKMPFFSHIEIKGQDFARNGAVPVLMAHTDAPKCLILLEMPFLSLIELNGTNFAPN